MYNIVFRLLSDEDILLNQFYLLIYKHLLFLLSNFFATFANALQKFTAVNFTMVSFTHNES